MANANRPPEKPPGPLASSAEPRLGLRPASSVGSLGMRARDVGVVVVAAALLLGAAAGMSVLSVNASITLTILIGGVALVWLRFSPTTVAMQRRAASPSPVQASARAQFPLTPETGVAIIERLPDPIILLDKSGRILLHNRAAGTIVGKSAARRHISTVMRAPEVLEAVAQVIAGEPAQVVEYEQPVPIERHYQAFVAPVIAAAQDIPKESARNILILLHDLTTLKRAEQMRADFVANASHELRTPLASLAGFVETLQGPARDDPEARDRFLSIMQDQARRMGRLINDLLSLSRIELNEHVRPANRVDLASIVNDTADMLTPLAEKEGVEIVMEIEPDLPQPFGDRDELVQVCQNLLANALKYGGTGKRVEVFVGWAHPPGQDAGPGSSGRLKVSFRDFGPGIERAHLPRLTERFYRVDVEQSRQRGGTGLGLAIVKHIMNRHMGSLTIDSEIGAGSTFTVFLPVEPTGQPSRASDDVTQKPVDAPFAD